MKPKSTICVIDDDDLVRRTICDALEEAGYQVVQSGVGTEGLEIIAKSNPCVAVMDMIMPDREGHDLIVEASRRFPKTKILAISGGGRSGPVEHLELALQLGAADSLAKPFRRHELVAKVKQLAR